jgi:uncharacterized protein involved in outer membrane biogenesis
VFRRFLIIQALVAIFLMAAGVGAFFFVKNEDFGSFVAQKISEKLGRKVEIASLRISPGRWIGVELRNVTLANLESGSHADMLSLRDLQAEIDSWSLLFAATPLVRSLIVEGVTLRLEKIHGHKNWHFGEMSFWTNVILEKCHFGKISFWKNIILEKCHFGKVLLWKMSFCGWCHFIRCP